MSVQEGQRIRAVSFRVDPGSPFDDNKTVPAGTEGTVDHVFKPTSLTPGGQIGVKWDNGSSISILPDVDRFEVIE